MNRTGLLSALAVLTLALTTAAGARILRVPAAYRTIQGAATMANGGDTVLVAPGRYRENVNLSDRDIVLASWILNADEAEYIDSTIIDGDSVDCCIALDSTNSEATVVRGFTLTRGFQNFGGGIDVQANAAPQLLDLKVTGNWANMIGAGIYVTSNATPLIERCVITDNYAQDGAGIGLAHECHPIIRNCIITDNVAFSRGGGVYAGHVYGEGTLEFVVIARNSANIGGGIYFEQSRHNILRNVTIVANEAQTRTGGMHLYGSGMIASDVQMVNCILWNATSPEITLEFTGREGGDTLTVDYCDVRDGGDSVLVEVDGLLDWGDGNIMDDPLFVDEEEGDYHLTSNSPCIDAGDPDDPVDADSSRADIGALAFFGRGFLRGFVRVLEDDSALVGATVRTSYNVEATTDEQGHWEIPLARVGVFSLTASAEGYADSTLPDTTLELGDTLEFTFRLRSPGFTVAPDSVATEMDTAVHSAQFAITLNNPGDAPVIWSAKPHNRGESGLAPWEVRRSFEFGWDVGILRGAVFTGEAFAYLIGPEEGASYIYVVTREGDLVDMFQLGVMIYFWTIDMDWDGELLWFAYGHHLYGYNLNGNLVNDVEMDVGVRGVACDRESGDLYLLLSGGDLVAYDREFNNLDQWALGLDDVTSIGYRGDDPDNCPLYIYHTTGDSFITEQIDKVNLESREVISLWSATYEPPDIRDPGSAQMTDEYDPFGGWVMVTTFLRLFVPASSLEVRQVEEAAWWMELDTTAGMVDPGAQDEIALTISRVSPEGQTLEPGVYEGEIIFTHNAADGEARLPVTLTVEEPDGILDFGFWILDFGLGEPSPNPFNAVAVISYQLSVVSSVELQLYDISGRLVQTVVEGWQGAGEHRVTIDGERLSSGIYIIKLAAGRDVATRKIVCVK